MNLYVKGTTVDAARRFALRHDGTPPWEKFLEAINAEQRRVIEQPTNRSSWYDLSLYNSVIGEAAHYLSPDDPDRFLIDLGRFVMDEGVNSLYRAFFAISTPSFVLRGSAMLWRMFFKGSKLKVMSRSKKWSRVAILNASFCDMPLCTSIGGGMMSALEHAGAKGVELKQHSCRSRGGSQCDFHFTWR